MEKDVSSIVARQFSPVYWYLRDLALHRLASLFVRESNRTRSSMFLLFEMYFYYLCSWEWIENVPFLFFVTAKTTKIETTTSNTELDFFTHDRWITFLLSLFSHTLFFFFFFLLFVWQKGTMQQSAALGNEWTSIHRRPMCNLAFSSKPRNFNVHPVHAIVRPHR